MSTSIKETTSYPCDDKEVAQSMQHFNWMVDD